MSLLVGMAAGILYGGWAGARFWYLSLRSHPGWTLGLTALAMSLVWLCWRLANLRHRVRLSRLRRLAAERAGQDIGHFARDFERRSVDPWVIRATYEEIRGAEPELAAFPLRGDDPLGDEVLFGDPDSIDDVVARVSRRTGRTLRRCERNPLYGKTHTVRDLVAFMSLQALRASSAREGRLP